MAKQSKTDLNGTTHLVGGGALVVLGVAIASGGQAALVATALIVGGVLVCVVGVIRAIRYRS